ncbi:MAG: carboxypeptidase regulatory-like domain-containing protein, partial [Bacteroidetes bacterium]|nr:carboxypeptidase regulatory-like domain-containing protein [Bacteroidota bacterium]
MKKTITFQNISKGLFSFLLVLLSGVVLAQAVPEYMYFKFNAPGSQTNFASAPVGTNPAPLLGLTTGGTGQFGTAVVCSGLSGTTDYLNTGWATNLPNTGWTISMWLNGMPSNTTLYYIFGDPGALSFRCFLGGAAGAGNILLRGGGLTDVIVPGVSGGPVVVTFVYTGTALKFFKNGVLAGTVAQPSVTITGAGPFKVAGYSTSAGLPVGCFLDEWRMYNRALPDAEVLATWNVGLPVAPTGGTLSGVVTTASTGVPLAGATVAVGALNTTSAANGTYTLTGVPVGTQTATCSKTSYITQNQTVTIVLNTTTTQNFALVLLQPMRVSGTVTDASTGAPVVGAKVTVGTGATAVSTLTVAGGTYLTPAITVSGAQPIVIGKTGFIDFTGTVTLVPNTVTVQDAALLPTAVQPGIFTAALNNPVTPTAVNLTWGVPQGMYQIIYDDGTQDNFAIWAAAKNLNAMKFTPLAWPVKLVGGKVNLGVSTDYPADALPLTPFMMLAYKANGTGGLPGTPIDSVEVTPTGFGWADFSFTVPITINSGDFYLIMKQADVPPHAAGIGVDLTNTQLRSYSRFVTGGAPWIPAAGNFMMRAIVQGVGGPLMTKATSGNNLITAGAVDGLIYQKPVSTVTGYEGVADYMPMAVSYQVWRLKQGEEGNQGLWTSIWTGSVNNTVDNGWPTLLGGPYRWAVKAIYAPGSRFSAPTFSNVIGKDWTASVTVNVTLTCTAVLPAGTLVTLTSTVAGVDSNYSAMTDNTGKVVFPKVWKGNYDLKVTRFGFDNYTAAVVIDGDKVYDINLLGMKPAPTGMAVDEQTLLCTWNAPKIEVTVLFDNFTSGSFATNGWVAESANWLVETTVGNPAPDAEFYWMPDATNYDMSLVSKSLAGIGSSGLTLTYDIYYDMWSSDPSITLTTEILDGTTWVPLKQYNGGAPIPWTSETIDISAYTSKTFKIRFRSQGVDMLGLWSWDIDNVSIKATEDVSACIVAYNVYLNNVLENVTTDTSYVIPPGHVTYGTNYDACVKAVYASGYSLASCDNFTSRFLCAPKNLAGVAQESTAYLTWEKPLCTGSGCTLASYIYDGNISTNGTSINAGYNIRLGNYFPVTPATTSGVIKSVDIYFSSG